MNLQAVATAEDIHVADRPAEAPNDAPLVPLTFVELDRRISALPTYDADSPSATFRARVCMIAAVLFYLGTFAPQHLTTDIATKLYSTYILLAFEVVALIAALWFARGGLSSVIRPLKGFAKALDFSTSDHFAIRDWIASQPLDVLERYASMLQFRRDRLIQKLPLFAGNIPGLGVIPVLIGVYFQVQQVVAGRSLGLADEIFGVVLVSVYLMTWMGSSIKLRVEAMHMFLQDGLAEAKKLSGSVDGHSM